MVNRYTPHSEIDISANCVAGPDGPFVLYADYEKLRKRNAELEALVDSLERLAVGNVTGCGTCTSVVSRIVTFTKESQSAVPPHLRGPVIQAYADSDGVPPGEAL